MYAYEYSSYYDAAGYIGIVAAPITGVPTYCRKNRAERLTVKDFVIYAVSAGMKSRQSRLI